MSEQQHERIIGSLEARVEIHSDQIDKLFDETHHWQSEVRERIGIVAEEVKDEMHSIRSTFSSYEHNRQIEYRALSDKIDRMAKCEQPGLRRKVDFLDAAKLMLLLGLLIGAAVGAYYQGASVIASAAKVLP